MKYAQRSPPVDPMKFAALAREMLFRELPPGAETVTFDIRSTRAERRHKRQLAAEQFYRSVDSRNHMLCDEHVEFGSNVRNPPPGLLTGNNVLEYGVDVRHDPPAEYIRRADDMWAPRHNRRMQFRR